MKKRFAVPYTMSYDNLSRNMEVEAYDKKEAREIAVERLQSDQDVTHIASTAFIIYYGEVKD